MEESTVQFMTTSGLALAAQGPRAQGQGAHWPLGKDPGAPGVDSLSSGLWAQGPAKGLPKPAWTRNLLRIKKKRALLRKKTRKPPGSLYSPKEREGYIEREATVFKPIHSGSNKLKLISEPSLRGGVWSKERSPAPPELSPWPCPNWSSLPRSNRRKRQSITSQCSIFPIDFGGPGENNMEIDVKICRYLLRFVQPSEPAYAPPTLKKWNHLRTPQSDPKIHIQ